MRSADLLFARQRALDLLARYCHGERDVDGARVSQESLMAAQGTIDLLEARELRQQAEE